MLKLKIEGLSCSIKNKEILKDITVSFQQGEMAAVQAAVTTMGTMTIRKIHRTRTGNGLILRAET